MLTQLSNLLFSSSIKALDELIYPSRHDGAFVRCRELIAAVLFSKSHQVPPNALIEMLTSHLFQENIPNVVSLSSRQLQIVQPFIRHIYAVDTYFTKRDRSCHNRMQAVGRRSILFTSSQEYRYTDIERAVHRGAPDSLMCLQTYLKNLAVSMENSEDGVPDVPSRCSIPRVWEDVLVYLILVLRNHRKSCNV